MISVTQFELILKKRNLYNQQQSDQSNIVKMKKDILKWQSYKVNKVINKHIHKYECTSVI